MLEDDFLNFLKGFLTGVFILSIIMIFSALWIPDHHAIQLANAICKEHYGTEFERFEPDTNRNFAYHLDGVVCKKPVRTEKYDGLIVTIGGG